MAGMTAAIEQRYRYSRPSTLTATGGHAELCLATSGGQTAAGPAAHPRFFADFLGHPEQSASGMLAVARVARTRFFNPSAATLRDPVVTSNADRLRFEAFSSCCGVHARLDLLPGSLEGPALDVGTTNVDLNPPTRQALAGIRGGEPLHLEVGDGGITVTTMEATAVERKVPLPARWLKGFAEVQLATAGMDLVAELPPTEARRLLSGLPRSGRDGVLWLVPAGRSLRVTARPGPGAACLAGPDRLVRMAEPLLRFVEGLRVYGAPVPAGAGRTGRDLARASAWELVLRDARLVLTLSPEVSRGFSGEGGVLGDLTDDTAAEDADLLAVLLAWEPRVDVELLARRAGLPSERVLAALAHLGAAGRVGYDLAEGGYFHRELPFDPAALAAMHPRLGTARALLDAGSITFERDGDALVRSGDTIYLVRQAEDGPRCTCRWWGRYAGSRGPCKHVLAVRVARAAAGPARRAGVASEGMRS
jgi:SWIM zinc finger